MKKGKHTYLALYWLKRVFVVVSVPLLAATLAFYIFKALPGSFASEAQIKLFLPFSQHMSEDEKELSLKNKTHPLLTSMRSERSMELLSLSLLERDLTAPVAFSDETLWSELGLIKHKDSLIQLCQRKRAELDLGFPERGGDSSLHIILKELRYDPVSLQKRISIRQVPGTSIIGIQARTYKSALSTYMVDQYAKEYIRYYKIVEKERLEGALEVLEKLLTQRKAEMQEKKLSLEKMQAKLQRPQEQEEILVILAEIGELEINKKAERRRVEGLRAALVKFREENKKKSVVKAVHFSSDSSTHISEDYLVKEDQKQKEEKLMIELGATLARIQFLEQEIETLKGRLAMKEAEVLVPIKKDLENARMAYLDVLEKVNKTQSEYERVENTLTQVKWGKSRMKMPQSHKLMAILTGFASIFVWVIFLINIGFITIKAYVH